MKRVLFFTLEFIFVTSLFLSLVIFIKPGTSLFYKKSQIQLETIKQTYETFEFQVKVNNHLYNPNTLLVLEDEKFLDRIKLNEAYSGERCSYALSGVEEGYIYVLINPCLPSDPSSNGRTYRAFIRPYLITRTWGAIAFFALSLIFFAVTLGDAQNRRIVFASPFGIAKIWINGMAGSSFCQFANKLYKILAEKTGIMITNVWGVDFFIPNVLAPMVVLAAYCGSFAFLSSQYLPAGVNFNFASALWKVLVGMIGVICLVIFIALIFKKFDKFRFKTSNEKFAVSDLLLLLLPLTPVVQYIINNREILSFINVLVILVFFMLLSSILILIIPEFLGKFSPTRTLKILGMAFLFTITNMAAVSHQFFWYETGNFWIQLVILAGVFLISLLIDKKILYLFLVLNFVSNGVFQLISLDPKADQATLPVQENNLVNIIGDRVPVTKPNIYLLVYDSYIPNETLLEHGFDNSPQENYLRSQGFKLYPHTYSVGLNTTASMDRVLNASTDYSGNNRKAVSGDGIVQNILKSWGYETWGIFPSDYMFRGTVSSYDLSIPKRKSNNYLIEGILLGEFKFDLGFYGQTQEQFMEEKLNLIKKGSENPLFVYTHSQLPGHSQISGMCQSDETDLYVQRLENANIYMQQDIETVIANDPEAIIVVAGDHGPYLTKNCTDDTESYDISEISRLDMQDRFGTFLAIRWPTEKFVDYDDITVLQDLFPSIFAYLFNDAEILESKIEPVTLNTVANGMSIKNGIIYGGINDGEPLYLSENQ